MKIGQFITAIASLIFIPLIKMMLSLNNRSYEIEKQNTKLENEITHLIRDIQDIKHSLIDKVNDIEKRVTRLENEVSHLIDGKRNHK